MQSFEWSDTIASFLARSNEDDVVLEALEARLVGMPEEEYGDVDWIEVGPGPCTKTRRLLEHLVTEVGSFRLSVGLVEPDLRCLPCVFDVMRQAARLGVPRLNYFPVPLGAAVKKGALDARPGNWHLVTAIHCLYDAESLGSFGEAASQLQERGRRWRGYVVVEAPSSEIAEIRRDLTSVGLSPPSDVAMTVEEELRRRELPFDSMLIGCKALRLRTEGKESREGGVEPWLSRFLLGIDRLSWMNLGNGVQGQVEEIVGRALDGRSELNIPDQLFVVGN